MNTIDPRIKPCCVMLEPCTPKAQLTLSAELRNALHEKHLLTTRTRTKVISALDEINGKNIENDNKIFRSRAIEEILTSETIYLKQLEQIKEYFMKPIKSLNMLSSDDYQTLFGSLETIFNVNTQLLEELKANNNIAKAFSNMAPYLKLYSVYAYDYKKSLNILQKTRLENTTFLSLLERQESRPEVQSKLSALLITPIQRVPRYCLLLKQVLDYTSTTHDDYAVLGESLKLVESAAEHINALVEDQENTQRLLELQCSLQNNFPLIIKPGRKLIKEGVLTKMSQKNSNQSFKRYFVLMNDIIMYCKLKKSNPKLAKSLKCSCILPLNKCRVGDISNKGVFKIFCEDEVLTLYHQHVSESEKWVAILKQSIKTYIDNRLTLRKESSSRRPVHNKHVSEYQDHGISPGRQRKKRKLVEQEYQTVFKNIKNDSEDSDVDTTYCFPIKVSRRPPVQSHDRETPSKIRKIMKNEKLDSLFPLREYCSKKVQKSLATHTTTDTHLTKKEDSTVVREKMQLDPTVFVFGEHNDQRRGFRFNMSNIFSGIGNSFKRMFGFGDN